jgi:hypothetical protein
VLVVDRLKIVLDGCVTKPYINDTAKPARHLADSVRTDIMRLATFHHSVFGWFTLPRCTARDYTTGEQIEAAALLVLQSGE